MAGEALREAVARKPDLRRLRWQERYWDDPAGWVQDHLRFSGDGPTPYQLEAMQKLTEKGRVAIRSPHGAGKTALAAWVILWFASTREGRDWKIPTTASAWRQLTKYLWPEVRKWSRRMRWSAIPLDSWRLKREMMNLSLKLRTGEAFALASSDPNAIEGAHAKHLLYVFDEAKAIPDGIWDSAEGAFASPEAGEALALAISTPGDTVGRFYEIHRRGPGLEDWWVRRWSLEEAVAAGRVTERWAEQRKLQWGERSAVYQNRVLGEFCASEGDGVISLTLVEAANQRWQEWADSGKPLEGKMDVVAVDVARSGEDQTAYALLYGDIITSIRRTSQEDTMKTTGRTVGMLRKGGVAIVDVIGIGAGVVDRLREMRQPVKAFNASRRSNKLDRSRELRFANLRAEAWWNLREMLEDGECALPPDDMLTGDLTAPRWFVHSGGRIQIESKDALRKEKRLGRSTDTGDAVVMAFWKPAGGVLRY